ncbi:hypothetical protein FRB98_004474 [Tulasnella sp. 332]|nr:hypothetical protein FRB98_004474 [Tulasnella sp. 332]
MDHLDGQEAGPLSSTSSSSPPIGDPFYITAIDDQSLPVWPTPLYTEQALIPPPATVKPDTILGRFSQDDISPSQSFLQEPSTPHILQPSHQGGRAFSTHVFYQRPPPSILTSHCSNGASSTSNSTSPSPASVTPRMHTFTVVPEQPSPEQPAFSIRPNTSRVIVSTEADDAPWNLVQSNAPWKPRGVTGPPGADVSSPGLVPSVMETGGMFMRSPTPTKRQRTNQACEKCRDRKAKCNGMCPCARCESRGLVCRYAEKRNMRGPNRGGAASGSSGQRRLSSSPSSSDPPSILSSNGHGELRSDRRESERVGTPPVAIGPHPLKSMRDSIAGATQTSPLALDIPLPVRRTVHVAQSFPDLHSEASRASDTSSTSSSPISVISFPHLDDAYISRPRSHTTPHPLPTTRIPTHTQYQPQKTNGHRSHLSHGFGSGVRARSDFSLSEPSEPPSTTSSGFSTNMWAFPASPSHPMPVAMSVAGHRGHSPANKSDIKFGQESITYPHSPVGFNGRNAPDDNVGFGRGSEDTICQNERSDVFSGQMQEEIARGGFDCRGQNWRDAPGGWDGGDSVTSTQKVHAGEFVELGSAPESLSSSASPMPYGYGTQLSLPLAIWDHNNLPAPHDSGTVPMPYLELSRMTVNPPPAAPSNYLCVSGEAGPRQTGHLFHSPLDIDFKAWFGDPPEMVYSHHNDHKVSDTGFDVATAIDATRNIDVYEVLNQ